MAMITKSKSTASTASSWWAERSKILASKTKPARAKPKPKKIKAKKVTKSLSEKPCRSESYPGTC